MCHRLGRKREGVLGSKRSIEARRDLSNSTRFIPPRAEILKSSGVILVFDAVLCGVGFFFNAGSFSVFAGFRGTVVVPRIVSPFTLNLSGAIRTRADIRTA
jgi:hypothetical protein